MLNELNEKQFTATVVQPFLQIPEDKKPVIDVIPYLRECNQTLKLLKTRPDFVPLQTYASGDNLHLHLIFWYGIPDRVLVLVANKLQRRIIGHHILKIDDEGGSAGFPWPIKTPRHPTLSAFNKRDPEEGEHLS